MNAQMECDYPHGTHDRDLTPGPDSRSQRQNIPHVLRKFDIPDGYARWASMLHPDGCHQVMQDRCYMPLMLVLWLDRLDSDRFR